MGGAVVDDLVQRDGREIGELHFDDRAHALDGGPEGHACHGVLGDRAVEHAAGMFGEQAFGGFESAAEVPDVLAVEEDALVLAEGVVKGRGDGVDVGGLGHVR